jgi:hypothetical protein
MDSAHERRRSRPRLAIGEHALDLVRAEMPRRADQLCTIAFRELGCEQADRRQVQIPAAQGRQDLGMTPRRPSGVDPLVGNPFCEVEHPR